MGTFIESVAHNRCANQKRSSRRQCDKITGRVRLPGGSIPVFQTRAVVGNRCGSGNQTQLNLLSGNASDGEDNLGRTFIHRDTGHGRHRPNGDAAGIRVRKSRLIKRGHRQRIRARITRGRCILERSQCRVDLAARSVESDAFRSVGGLIARSGARVVNFGTTSKGHHSIDRIVAQVTRLGDGEGALQDAHGDRLNIIIQVSHGKQAASGKSIGRFRLHRYGGGTRVDRRIVRARHGDAECGSGHEVASILDLIGEDIRRRRTLALRKRLNGRIAAVHRVDKTAVRPDVQ